MYALLRSPARVPTLFSLPREAPAGVTKKRFVNRRAPVPATFDGMGSSAVEPAVGSGQWIAAACVLVLLYAVPFLKLGDVMLDAAGAR